MSNIAQQMFRGSLNYLVRRVGWVGVISTMGILSGWLPGLSNDVLTLTGSPAAYAQSSFSNDQVNNYAQAVLAMEPLRQRSYQQVQRLMGGKTPDDVCRQEGLPNPVRIICDRFFQESAEIIKGNRLSLNEFNQITQRAQNDSALKNRIQQALIRFQQNRR